MTNRPSKIAPGDAFVKMPRDLLESAAWRTLGINARRLIDFLMLEHLRNGGRKNGLLIAPVRQLQKVGIGTHYTTSAIDEAERAGLIDCQRGERRVANTYTLNWLPLHDGAEPMRRWKEKPSYDSPRCFACRSAGKKNWKSDCQSAGTSDCQSAVKRHSFACRSAGKEAQNHAC